MNSNVTGAVFETDCEVGRPIGLVIGNNLRAICTEPGSPNLAASESVTVKAGLVSAESFSGTPLVAQVTFETALPDTNYSIAISGVDARIFSYQSKETTGFIINTNANGALSGEVSWIVTPVGET
jgi:hypothetical protein